MANQIPFYSATGIFTMLTPAYIQPWDGNVTTEPLTKTAAISLIAGGKSKETVTPPIASTGGDYNIFNTPQNRYCFYVTTPPSATLYDVAVPVTAWVDAASGVANIVAAAKKQVDIAVSYDDTTVTLEAMVGGLCNVNTESGDSFPLSVLVTGSGNWGKIGKLADDLAVTPESIIVVDSEKEENQVGAKFTVEFNLISVSARALKILKTDWNNKKVNIAFIDETNDEYPMFILHNQTLTILPDIMNRDGAKINFKATKQYKDWDTYIKYWDFADEV